MHEVRFQVPDMSCGHCTAAVQAALETLAGVSAVDVSLDTKMIIVRSDIRIEASDVEAAIRGAGYTPGPAADGDTP
jgi:copper chaperone